MTTADEERQILHEVLSYCPRPSRLQEGILEDGVCSMEAADDEADKTS